MQKKQVHPEIRKRLTCPDNYTDQDILKDWRHRTRTVCKPCWELKYCPFGPLVEDFPLLPPILAEAEEHHNYLKKCLKTEKLADGTKLEGWRKKYFQKEVRRFRRNKYPDKIPRIIEESQCKVFGHICPVFLVAEPLTETKERRKHSRLIPRDVMLKVIRRDGQICQACFQPVPDTEVEFDHIIPFSKGGTSTVDNLRLLCADCNRQKRDSLKGLLSTNPIDHLYEIQQQKRNKKKA
jgi:hypothetical protein